MNDCEPQREKAVYRAVGILDADIDRLEKEVGRLSESLSRVLSQDTPCNTEKDCEKSPASCELEGTLKLMSDRLCALRERVENITSRLEV